MKLLDLPKFFVVFLIKTYQKTLSFDHGPLKFLHPYGYCRFHPTCSEYSKQAVEKFGVFKGGYLAFWRVLRCHPWSKGGIDEVPEIQKIDIGNPDDESKEGNNLSDQDFVKIIDLCRKQIVVPNKKLFKPFIICPVGLVGSGKTTIIKLLAEYFGLVRISNDEIRKILNDNGFNLIRTKELSFSLIKEFVKKGLGVAIDADCAGLNVVETINKFAFQEKIEVFLIHINTPEKFILENIRKFRSNADNFIETYYKRKPLHENLNLPFIYTFDLSKGSVVEQAKECEKIIELKLEK